MIFSGGIAQLAAGNGLKIRPVWVRIPLPLPLKIRRFIREGSSPSPGTKKIRKRMRMKMQNIKDLFDARYEHILSGGGDPWVLTGNYGGQKIYPTHPVEFDEKEMIIKTFSGSLYRLYDISSENIEQIKTDIKNGGYEVH